MRHETTSINDFDLLAYADGRLDPHRRRLVEAWLVENPEAAEQVRADAAITEAIRILYDPVMNEPVPERHQAILNRQRSLPVRRTWRFSAMAASVIGAGVLGWWAGGQNTTPAGMAVDQRLLSQVTAAYLDGSATVSPASVTAGIPGAGPNLGNGPLAAVSALNERMTFEVQAPDLTALGYTMLGQRIAETQYGDVVEVNYADASGERLALFLRTRWQDNQPRFRATQQQNVSTAYWYDGPLALALAGDAEPEVIRDLGMSVHELMKAGGHSQPSLKPPAEIDFPSLDADSPTEEGLQTAGQSSAQNVGSGSVPGSMDVRRLMNPGDVGRSGSGQPTGSLIVPESIFAPATVQQVDQEM
jgi:anti-sigma factor RsiW